MPRVKNSPPTQGTTAPASVLEETPARGGDNWNAPAAVAAQETFRLPVIQQGESPWQYMQRLTQDEWTDVIGYLYRTKPTANRIPGAEGYLFRFTEPITIEFVKEKFGGLAYRMHLNRRSTGVNLMLFNPKGFRFDVEAPPIMQTGEIFSDGTPKPAVAGPMAAPDQTSGQILALLERMLTDMIRQRDQATAKGENFNTGDAVRAALEMQKDAATQAIALVRDQARTPAATAPGFDFSELLKSVVPLLVPLLTRALTPADPAAEMQKWMTIIEGLRGSDGGSTGKTTIVDLGMEFVRSNPNFLSDATELVRSLASTRATTGPQPVPGAAPPRLPAPMPPANQPPGVRPATAVPPNLQSTAATSAPPQPQNGSVAGAPPPPITEEEASMVIVARINQMLINKLFEPSGPDDDPDFEPGFAAAEVADAMHRPYAQHLAKTLKTNPAMLQNDPILSKAMTHPNCMVFCQQYCSFFEDDGADATPAPTPTPTTTAVQ